MSRERGSCCARVPSYLCRERRDRAPAPHRIAVLGAQVRPNGKLESVSLECLLVLAVPGLKCPNQRLLQERLLGLEVCVERADRQADLAHDLREANPGNAVLAKETRGRVQDPFTGRFVVFASVTHGTFVSFGRNRGAPTDGSILILPWSSIPAGVSEERDNDRDDLGERPEQTGDVGGTTFAYRELGPASGVPVVFLNHLVPPGNPTS